MSLQELEKEIETRKETSSKQITEETRKECIEILASSVSTLSEELQKIKIQEKIQDAESLARQVSEVTVEKDKYKYKGESKSILSIKTKEKLIKWKKRIDLKKQREFAWKYGLQFNQEDNTLSYRGKTRAYIEFSTEIKNWKKQIDERLNQERRERLEKEAQERKERFKKEAKERKRKLQKEKIQKTVEQVKLVSKGVLIASLITVGGCEYHKNKKMDYYKNTMSNITHLDETDAKYLSKFKNNLNLTGISSLSSQDALYISDFHTKKIEFENIEINASNLMLLLGYQGKIICDKLTITDLKNKYQKILEELLINHEIKELYIFGYSLNKTTARTVLENFQGKKLNIIGYNIDTDLIEIVEKASYNLELGYIKDLTIEKFNILSSTKNISFDKSETLDNIIENIQFTPENIELLSSLQYNFIFGVIKNIDISTFRLLQKKGNIKFDEKGTLEHIAKNMEITPDNIDLLDQLGIKIDLGTFRHLSISNFNLLKNRKNISFNEKKTAKMIADDISYKKNLTLDEFIFTLKHGTYISNTQMGQIKMIDINTPYIKKEFISYIDKYKIGGINFRNSNTTNLSIYYTLQTNIKYLNISGKKIDNDIVKYISMSNLECIKIFELKDWSTTLKLLYKSNIKHIDLREANLHGVDKDYLVEYGDRFILPEYTTNYIKKIRQENNRNKYYNKYKAPEDKIRTTFSGGHTTIHLETNMKASIAEKYPLCEYDNQGLPETSPCYTRGKGTYIVRERK